MRVAGVECPNCGASIPDTRGVCLSCGKVLGILGESSKARETAAKGFSPDSKKQSGVLHRQMMESFNHGDIARKWKLDYSFAVKDQTNRTLDGVQKLFSHFQKPETDIRALLEDAANLIAQQLRIREVTIGLRSPVDGLYRYEVMVGARADAEKAFRRIAYTADDFRENSKYKGTSLSKYSKLFLAEDSPYADGEKDSYSRPFLLGMKRGSMTESLEGDYLDVHIYGMEDDLVGWIELSGTKTGNIPDVTTIRWVELISKIIGTAITSQNARSAKGKKGRWNGQLPKVGC